MLLQSVISLSLLLVSVGAQSSSNWTTTDCVSPDGFNSCFGAASNKASTCLKETTANGVDALTCQCQLYLDELSCALEDCWNEVYSCQYQELVVRYLMFCPSSSPTQFPFFPAPDNALGGCSCNLGYVFNNITNAISQGGSCVGPGLDGEVGCICCTEAGAYSAIYDICPDTDPNQIGLSTVNTDFLVYDQPFDQCGQYLDEFDCVNDLGFSPIGTISSYIQPSATSSAGTNSLSTMGGSITSPLGGPTTVWSAPAGNMYTIVAASAADAQATGGSSSTGGSSNGGSGGSSDAGARSQAIGIGGEIMLAVACVLATLSSIAW